MRLQYFFEFKKSCDPERLTVFTNLLILRIHDYLSIYIKLLIIGYC